jgi:cob(I)alamin adenosyltransferase
MMTDPSEIGSGFIHLYTGEGKGKTTAALGLALRAAGCGLRVLVVQFLKGGETGEREAARSLCPLLEIRPRGGEGFVDPAHPREADRLMAGEALAESAREVASGDWDLVVLDEINTAAHFGLVSPAEVLALCAAKPPGVELVLTGRHAPAALVERADLVTEMREVKHYFRRGIAARRGIER